MSTNFDKLCGVECKLDTSDYILKRYRNIKNIYKHMVSIFSYNELC